MKKLYLLLSAVCFAANAQTGSWCETPIVVPALPYNTTDNTANYADNYTPSTGSSPACSATTNGNYYHGGNDVIYAYTAQASGTVKFEMSNVVGWTAMFIYLNCADIGISYAGCAVGTSAGTRVIDDFPVTAGETYYIFLSSWPAPQTFSYTLNVTQVTLGTSEVVQNNSAVLYPNPASETIRLESPDPVNRIVIYDTTGKKCLETTSTTEALDISRLARGFYILEAQTNDGNFRKNFIKS